LWRLGQTDRDDGTAVALFPSMPRALRRLLVPRLLTPRVPRRIQQPVGVCGACGVGFIAPADRVDHAEEILRLHESICPGGERAGDVVHPYD